MKYQARIFLVSFYPSNSPIHQQGQSVTPQISTWTFVTCHMRVQTLRSAQQFLQWRSSSTRNSLGSYTAGTDSAPSRERSASHSHSTGVLLTAVLTISWQRGEEWRVRFTCHHHPGKCRTLATKSHRTSFHSARGWELQTCLIAVTYKVRHGENVILILLSQGGAAATHEGHPSTVEAVRRGSLIYSS